MPMCSIVCSYVHVQFEGKISFSLISGFLIPIFFYLIKRIFEALWLYIFSC